MLTPPGHAAADTLPLPLRQLLTCRHHYAIGWLPLIRLSPLPTPLSCRHFRH
jgi:hypothetical protein